MNMTVKVAMKISCCSFLDTVRQYKCVFPVGFCNDIHNVLAILFLINCTIVGNIANQWPLLFLEKSDILNHYLKSAKKQMKQENISCSNTVLHDSKSWKTRIVSNAVDGDMRYSLQAFLAMGSACKCLSSGAACPNDTRWERWAQSDAEKQLKEISARCLNDLC